MDAATIGSMLASFFILFAASLALGVAIGLGGAWLIKRTRAGGDRHAGTPGALGLLCTSAYLAYLAGDAAGLSGIVALFCAAVVLAHYGLPSLTRTDRVAVRAAVGAASLVAEGAIFAFVGLAALDPGQWGRTHWPSALGIASAVLLLMLASRAAWLAPVVWAHNRWGGTAPLSRREGGAAWWAGSMRGAVSVALVCFYYGRRWGHARQGVHAGVGHAHCGPGVHAWLWGGDQARAGTVVGEWRCGWRGRGGRGRARGPPAARRRPGAQSQACCSCCCCYCCYCCCGFCCCRPSTSSTPTAGGAGVDGGGQPAG